MSQCPEGKVSTGYVRSLKEAFPRMDPGENPLLTSAVSWNEEMKQAMSTGSFWSSCPEKALEEQCKASSEKMRTSSYRGPRQPMTMSGKKTHASKARNSSKPS